MERPRNDLTAVSDADLIELTRAGDQAAYSELFERHRPVALGVARSVARPEHVDDIVAEAFARVLSLLRDGRGPNLAFRPYLLATVRNVHLNLVRARQRETLVADHSEVEHLEAVDDGIDTRLENNTISRAYGRLPERWQTVLWMTAVEGRPSEEVARHLGIKANAVAALAFRAREGLREAYLADHLQGVTDAACQRVVDLLPAYLRGNLTARRNRIVVEHLETCLQCTALATELETANRNFAALIAPLIVGPLIARAAWGIDPVPALPWLGAHLGGSSATAGWSALGIKAAAGLTAAASLGAIVAGSPDLLHERPTDVEGPTAVFRVDEDRPREATSRAPRPERPTAPAVPVAAADEARDLAGIGDTGHPRAERHPTPVPSPSTVTPTPEPTAPAANPRIGAPSSRNNLLWTTASLPLLDAPAGTVMTVTTSHVVLAGTENLSGTGWSCGRTGYEWFEDGLWARTTTTCTWDGTGTGVLRIAYRLFGFEAPLTAGLTTIPGTNADVTDDAVQMTLGPRRTA